jgi:hypothetical protein
VTESKLRRPRKQPNARLKQRVIDMLATLKKLYNRKASTAPAARVQKKCRTVATAGGVAAEPPAAPRTHTGHTTRSGRTATLYN